MTEEQKKLWDLAKESGVTAIPLAYGTSNLGDDIQTESGLRFFSTIHTVPRDHAKQWKGHKIAMCGWFGHIAFDALSEDVVVIGMHLHPDFAKSIDINGWKKLDQIVRSQGFPAGCRDTHTRDLLRSKGIEAEFSGCVTQLFPGYEGERAGKFAVDTSPPNPSWKQITHRRAALSTMDAVGRLGMASEALDQYKTAEKIITSRLHCYLPAQAMGVPVVKYGESGPINPARWTGHLSLTK